MKAKQDLIVHRLEIIGEAAKRISNKTITNYDSIPWREIKGIEGCFNTPI